VDPELLGAGAGSHLIARTRLKIYSIYDFSILVDLSFLILLYQLGIQV